MRKGLLAKRVLSTRRGEEQRVGLDVEPWLAETAAQMIERKTLDLILESATYEDVPVNEDLQPMVTTSAEQVVPGELRDIDAEAAEAAKAAESGESPPQS